MAETLNLIQKLAKIRAISDVVAKEKRGYNYSYADITTILAKITAGMKKYGVSLIPQIVPGTANVEQSVSSTTKFTKTGEAYEAKTTEMLVTADMIFKCGAYSQQKYKHQYCCVVGCILQISFSSYRISLSFNQSFVINIRSISISSPSHFYFVLYCFIDFSCPCICPYESS